jgi:hypothetical protein
LFGRLDVSTANTPKLALDVFFSTCSFEFSFELCEAFYQHIRCFLYLGSDVSDVHSVKQLHVTHCRLKVSLCERACTFLDNVELYPLMASYQCAPLAVKRALCCDCHRAKHLYRVEGDSWMHRGTVLHAKMKQT